ncbi:phosphoglycolate phosphatase [Pseudoxanthomonas dokdonensis]|uniref:Phosphoglycolate phosphatase n=1 Tax=Pseudoxanthomonas dokdonensis TaxID=344882 RepID=A0A0R0CND0_9GAMM|nr:phosphoglycolate phosphatase [Pseudoxanthomonas dokdonensis]KRG70918.1 phosphoglycolate phosphatase [Pseudoxanthomonas dokdonensis]
MKGNDVDGSNVSRPAPVGFPRVVLFDLDGTLLDSAPDMLATANQLRQAHGEAAMSLEQIRPHVSKGSRAMLAAAFPALAVAERDALVQPFLDAYQGLSGQHARLFDGVEPMLAALEAAGTAWGIVTNKPEYLAREILPMLGWQQRCQVLIGGDSLAERKPHPLPLQVAAERLGVAPAECVYVGDDERDIVAARAAGMPSIAALWGYRQADEQPAQWQADMMCEQASELLDPARWPSTRSERGDG